MINFDSKTIVSLNAKEQTLKLIRIIVIRSEVRNDCADS